MDQRNTTTVDTVEPLVENVQRATAPDIVFDHHSTLFPLRAKQQITWCVSLHDRHPSDYTMSGYVYNHEEGKTYISCGGLLVRVPLSEPTIDTFCYVSFTAG